MRAQQFARWSGDWRTHHRRVMCYQTYKYWLHGFRNAVPNTGNPRIDPEEFMDYAASDLHCHHGDIGTGQKLSGHLNTGVIGPKRSSRSTCERLTQRELPLRLTTISLQSQRHYAEYLPPL